MLHMVVLALDLDCRSTLLMTQADVMNRTIENLIVWQDIPGDLLFRHLR